MSEKADKTKDKNKKDKNKKGKNKKGKGKAGAASAGPSIAGHPRAFYQVRRAKGWGGLAGFGIAAYLSYKAGVPTVDLGLRAIVAGITGYMLAWACAVTVWRHLVLAELRAAAGNGSAPNPDLIPARATPANAAGQAAGAASSTGAPSGS